MTQKPIYTQKHFIDLAQWIKTLAIENKYQFAQEIASHMQSINPKFNVSRFFKACGLTMYTECTEEQEEQEEPLDLPTVAEELAYLENQTAQEEAFTEQDID